MTQREMELREELDKMTESILNFLNSNRTKKDEQELMMVSDIKYCSECGNYNYEEKWIHQVWDINETEDKVCPCHKDNV